MIDKLSNFIKSIYQSNTIISHDKIITSPVLTATIVFFLTSLVVILLSIGFYDSEFLEGILVEAHGMLLDVLIIGILLLWLDLLRDQRLQNEKLQHIIDDFRGWKSKEAAYRTIGNIKRLNENGVTEIDLHNCHLKEMDFSRLDLSNASVQSADLGNAYLRRSRCKGTDFEGSYLGNTTFRGVDLRGANFERANCQRATFKGADMRNVNLYRASMLEANLYGVNLQGSNLEDTSFKETILRQADLRDCEGIEVEQLLEAKTLYGAELEPGIKEKIQESSPELLKKP